MHRHIWILMLIAVSAMGCGKQPEQAQEKASPSPDPAKSEQAPAAAAAIDCTTLAREVRQACIDRYENGLQIDCVGYAATVSTYTSSRPDVAESDTKAKVRAKLCDRIGKEFHQARIAASTKPVEPACVALGKFLDEKCFRLIGQPGYNDSQCDEWLSSSLPLTKEACTITQQLANTLQGG